VIQDFAKRAQKLISFGHFFFKTLWNHSLPNDGPSDPRSAVYFGFSIRDG